MTLEIWLWCEDMTLIWYDFDKMWLWYDFDGEILDLNIDKDFNFRRHIKNLYRIAH